MTDSPTCLIRDERPEDREAIREVITAAFRQEEEARLVERLEAESTERLSLVAVVGPRIVGHVLFSPVTLILDVGGSIVGSGLAPLAVTPRHQRQGLGRALTRAGLARLDNRGVPFTVVLGHPDYYARSGFEPAADLGIRCEFPGVPDGAFRLRRHPDRLVELGSGLVRYHPFFGGEPEG